MTDIMINKKFYSWQDVERACLSIALQMYNDNWKPDYIVGITRGGNVPATILSNMLNIRCEALKVSLRDDKDGHGSESNCWMAEDAFGYENWKINRHNEDISASAGEPIVNIPPSAKNILIVDDINDTGATFNWIMQDWQASCLPNEDRWNRVWGNNVKFATLTDNMASEVLVPINYTCDEINKAEEDVWLVYPWENVGTYG
jgi:hypoxanthine phosphoribosyltransferase